MKRKVNFSQKIILFSYFKGLSSDRVRKMHQRQESASSSVIKVHCVRRVHRPPSGKCIVSGECIVLRQESASCQENAGRKVHCGKRVHTLFCSEYTFILWQNIFKCMGNVSLQHKKQILKKWLLSSKGFKSYEVWPKIMD